MLTQSAIATKTNTTTRRAELLPLPELARELPTLPLTHGVYIAGRSYWTVAALVVLLRDGIGRMTDGDLERMCELGALAHDEIKARKGN